MIKSAYKKNLKKEWKSSHNLIFEIAPFEYDSDTFRFRIGTCDGIWTVQGKSYCIIAVTNRERGNGHFEDVLEFFERSCRRDGYSLRVLEFVNQRLKRHFIEKRGFKEISGNSVEKIFI